VAGPSPAEPENFVAHRDVGDIGSYYGHDARKVAALAGGKRGWKHLMHATNPNPGLTGVDAGGAKLDQHFAWPRRGHVDVGQIQYVAPAVAVETHGPPSCRCHEITSPALIFTCGSCLAKAVVSMSKWVCFLLR